MMIPIPNIFLLICCLIWIFLDIFVFLKKIRNRTYVSYFKVFLSVVLILLFIIVYSSLYFSDIAAIILLLTSYIEKLSNITIYCNFSLINSASFSASFCMTSKSFPSIITRTRGSVPEVRINTLPSPLNLAFKFSMACLISGTFI